MNLEVYKSLKFNLTVNILDGGFFGFALGFASFSTVIPLFVSTMTDSAILIGLIPAIHSVGWQLPQLLLANKVAQQRQFKPMVLLNTIHERVPFLGLAIIAGLIPVIGKEVALPLTFLMLIWQGLGGGITANAWQTMIGKIIPANNRGMFFGAQSSALSLLASVGAVIAGFILAKYKNSTGFSLCFFLASINLVISFIAIALTREPVNAPVETSLNPTNFLAGVGKILKKDKNFRWYLIARMLCQLSVMGFAFYTVYAVRYHGVSEVGVGWMTSVLLGTQIIVNPLLGWLGDRWGHHGLIEIGFIAATLSTLTAWWAPAPGWFYLTFTLAGIANVAIWTIGMAILLEFGNETERPTYIGMANTLVAPVTILAPFLGGWLADMAGYQAAFLASAVCGVVTTLVFHYQVKDPRRLSNQENQPASSTEG